MTHFGEHWGGVCLAEEYTLGQFLRAADDSGGEGAFYKARNSAGESVLVKLAAVENAEERIFLWRRTAYLQHPNLLQMLDSGRTEEHVYAVFEWPDDFLATALEQGALEERDARDFLSASLDALRYLHAQGLVHGSLDAAHVVAVGSAVKLSTDNLREPDGEFTCAGDIGALGALLYRILTGREFSGSVQDAPEPFVRIIRNTAAVRPDDRWRIPEILAAMPPARVPEPEPPPAMAAAAAAASAAPAVAAAEPPPPAPAPAPIVVKAPPPALTGPRIPRWAWPASIAVLAGCFAWVLHTPSHKQAPPPAPAAPAPASAPVQLPAPRREPPPAAVPDRPAQPPAQAAEAPRERTVWRVVVYTYNAVRDAERKATAINRKWPGFHAEVFAPKGRDNPPYLVAVGGRMDRLEAARMLQRARSRGLPRDTFMLNFAE